MVNPTAIKMERKKVEKSEKREKITRIEETTEITKERKTEKNMQKRLYLPLYHGTYITW